MLDKTIPFSFVIMVKEDMDNYPNYSLPSNYKFKMYEEGDEVLWAEIEKSVNQFETIQEGIDNFNLEFGKDIEKKKKRIVFVEDENKRLIATGALWDGNFNGVLKEKIHWVAVHEEYKGKETYKKFVCKP